MDPSHERLQGRILVTGGAGFIGSALVRALNEAGSSRIVIADLLGHDEKWKNLAPLAFEDYVEADRFLAAIESNAAAFGRFDAIFHLGACSSTTETDAAYLIRNNFEFTKSLCRWSLAQEARFVYASSAATYGDGTRGMRDDVDPSVFRPLNMYGYSKQLFDLWALREGLLPNIVGLKYFNVFGPNEYHKGSMRSLVCKAFEQIGSTGEITLFRSHRPDYRDGEQMRDFVYVKDAVAMTLHLAGHATAGGLFNIGTGQPRTWLDLARALFRAMGVPEKIEFVDMPPAIRGQYQYYTAADITRLQSTNYRSSFFTLEDAILDYVTRYLIPHARLGDEIDQG